MSSVLPLLVLDAKWCEGQTALGLRGKNKTNLSLCKEVCLFNCYTNLSRFIY